MEHEKYSYVEALRWLANKYNVEIEETEVSPEVKALQLTSDSLYIVNAFAQKYFSDILFNTDEGRDIGLSYLKERGFREDVIQKFQLGYCLQERDAFSTEALRSQYNQELLIKSGLTVLRDERLVDNYRGRIIFPVHNQSGKVAGFGARIIGKNDRAPKYINTPENEIYIKSRILYGSYLARQAIDKNDECLLVEGYTDVISLHQAGIENVVASGGTSLTHDQLRLIKKYTNNLTIIYDGDAAGVKAAMRGLDLALEESLNVQLVLIPDKEDPDSYVNKVGPTQFREFVQRSKKDFILFQLDVLLSEAGNDSAKKSAVVNTIAETISRINKPEDFSRRQDYIRNASEILKIDENGFINLVNKFVREKISKEGNAKGFDFTAPAPIPQLQPVEDDDILSLFQRDELHERAIVRCLIEFGLKEWNEGQRVADYLLEEFLDQQLIEDPSLVAIMETYKKWYQEGLEPTEKNFLYYEDQKMSAAVVSLLEFAHELSPNWDKIYEVRVSKIGDFYKEDVLYSVNYLKLRKIRKMIEENQHDMNNIKSDKDLMVAIQTHQHLKELAKELTSVLGTVIYK
jgi:DNA primase